jgi:nucleoside-diphosphate kinase
MTRLQLTLANLKPDVTPMTYSVLNIRDRILSAGFLVVRSKCLRLNRARAEEFYSEHEGKFFYNRLVGFMSSGESHAHVLAKENAIRDWRAMLGATKVFKTRFEQPDTIRGQFGLTDTRNVAHGSDSNESAAKEIGFFFPEFSIDSFYAGEEPTFRKGGDDVQLDPKVFVHKLKAFPA